MSETPDLLSITQPKYRKVSQQTNQFTRRK